MYWPTRTKGKCDGARLLEVCQGRVRVTYSSGVESLTHKALKVAVVELLRGRREMGGGEAACGCTAVGMEVRCPVARHRVDVAGYLDPLPKASVGKRRARPPEGEGVEAGLLERGERARTVIVECKQSRADFLTDRADSSRLMELRARLEQQRTEMEQGIIRACEPELRRSGTSLFVELETWDYARSRLPAYRELLRELAGVEKQLHGSVKFWRMAHYRLADALYVAAPAGMVREQELPRHWGLIEMARREVNGALGNGEHAGAWRIVKRAPDLDAREVYRRRLLRNIAAALSARQVIRGSDEPAG